MTYAERFEIVTGHAATTATVIAAQRWLGITDDGKLGPITMACIESEWSRCGKSFTPVDLVDGELLFVRCPGAARTLTQRDHTGAVRYDCRVYWREDDVIRSERARTLPMQSASKASPLGHVAVVRPGEWATTKTTHKGAPALRFVGETLCWRNLSSLPVVTATDRARSEALRKGEYPQAGARGLYATAILFHPGPPLGFSIGCFTAERDTVDHLASIAPEGGWRIRLIDPREEA